MSEIVKTDAIVLRAIKYGDTSKIVTFYSRQSGKLTGIVKGARQEKNKYGSTLQPMSHVSLVVYVKHSRDVQTVAQCDLIKSYRTLTENLEKMSIGLKIIELTTSIAHESEANPAFFTLLAGSMASLDEAKKNPSNVLASFEIHLCEILGFALTLDKCIGCSSATSLHISNREKVKFHLEKGSPLCPGCENMTGQKTTVRSDVIQAMQRIAESKSLDELLGIELDREVRQEVESVLWTYLRYHVSGLRSLKTERVFSKILSDS